MICDVDVCFYFHNIIPSFPVENLSRPKWRDHASSRCTQLSCSGNARSSRPHLIVSFNGQSRPNDLHPMRARLLRGQHEWSGGECAVPQTAKSRMGTFKFMV